MKSEVFAILKTSVEMSGLGIQLANMILNECVDKEEARAVLKKLESNQRRMQNITKKPIDIICQ